MPASQAGRRRFDPGLPLQTLVQRNPAISKIANKHADGACFAFHYDRPARLCLRPACGGYFPFVLGGDRNQVRGKIVAAALQTGFMNRLHFCFVVNIAPDDAAQQFVAYRFNNAVGAQEKIISGFNVVAFVNIRMNLKTAVDLSKERGKGCQLRSFWLSDTSKQHFEVVTDTQPDGLSFELLRSLREPCLQQGRYAC